MVNLEKAVDRIIADLIPFCESKDCNELYKIIMESVKLTFHGCVELLYCLGETTPDPVSRPFRKAPMWEMLPECVDVLTLGHMYNAIAHKTYGVKWFYKYPDTYALVGMMIKRREQLRNHIVDTLSTNADDSDLTECQRKMLATKAFINAVPGMTIRQHSIFAYTGVYDPMGDTNTFFDMVDQRFHILCGQTDVIVVEHGKGFECAAFMREFIPTKIDCQTVTRDELPLHLPKSICAVRKQSTDKEGAKC